MPPSEDLASAFLPALREFREEGLSWWTSDDAALADRDFPAFVAKKLGEASPSDPSTVPKTHRWAMADGAFVGRIAIHHALTDALRVAGGHIGYDTVPSFRGRGVATAMLRAALPIARSLGLTEVLLTCDATNAASIRVIERNGGALRETKVLDPARPAKRYYWIALA